MLKTFNIKYKHLAIFFTLTGLSLALFSLFFIESFPSLGNYIGTILFIIFNFTCITRLISSPDNFLIRFPIFFILSNLLVSLISLLIRQLNISSTILDAGIVSYTFSFFALILFLILKSKSNKHKNETSLNLEILLVIVIVIMSFMIAQIIFNYGLRFNQTINIDAFQHLTAIKEIFINGNIEILLNKISSTFTLATYLPFFHYIFGLPISMGSQNLFIVNYRILEIFFSFTTGVIVLIGFKNIFKSIWIGLLAAIINFFAFESYGAYTSFFLLPQTLTAMVGASLILYNIAESSFKPTLTFITSLLIILMHFFVGPFIVLINTLIILNKKFAKLFNWLFTITIIILIVIFFASDIVSLDLTKSLGQIFPDFSQRESEFVLLGSLNILNSLFRTFGLFIIPIILFVLFSIFTKSNINKLIALIILFLLTLISIKFPYASKLLIVAHYLLLFPIILQFTFLDSLKLYLKIIIVSLSVLGFSLVLYTNSNNYKNIFTSENSANKILNYEYLIAEKINSKYDKDLIVLSDPLTMHIIEPLLEGKTSGGLFTDISTRKLIWLKLNNPEKQIYTNELQTEYPNKKVIYILTPRTIEWLKKEFNFIEGYGNQIWKITDFQNNSFEVIE